MKTYISQTLTISAVMLSVVDVYKRQFAGDSVHTDDERLSSKAVSDRCVSSVRN